MFLHCFPAYCTCTVIFRCVTNCVHRWFLCFLQDKFDLGDPSAHENSPLGTTSTAFLTTVVTPFLHYTVAESASVTSSCSVLVISSTIPLPSATSPSITPLSVPPVHLPLFWPLPSVHLPLLPSAPSLHQPHLSTLLSLHMSTTPLPICVTASATPLVTAVTPSAIPFPTTVTPSDTLNHPLSSASFQSSPCTTENMMWPRQDTLFEPPNQREDFMGQHPAGGTESCTDGLNIQLLQANTSLPDRVETHTLSQADPPVPLTPTSQADPSLSISTPALPTLLPPTPMTP